MTNPINVTIDEKMHIKANDMMVLNHIDLNLAGITKRIDDCLNGNPIMKSEVIIETVTIDNTIALLISHNAISAMLIRLLEILEQYSDSSILAKMVTEVRSDLPNINPIRTTIASLLINKDDYPEDKLTEVVTKIKNRLTSIHKFCQGGFIVIDQLRQLKK